MKYECRSGVPGPQHNTGRCAAAGQLAQAVTVSVSMLLCAGAACSLPGEDTKHIFR